MTHTPFDIRIEAPNTLRSLEMSQYAFGSSPVKLSEDEKTRYLAARSEDKGIFSYVDDVAVAKVGVIPMTQNVRGKVMAMGGIGGVCSMPSARRGGHVRALMNRAIEDMHTDGQAVSALYPFKTSYYEMFGYAGWQVALWARIKPFALAPYLNVPKFGVVTQRLTSDAKDDFYALLQAAQRTVHGMGSAPRVRFDNQQEEHPKWFVSVHEGDDITGGVCYTMDLDKRAMEVHSAYWLTENARLNLLDFMARHVDQVDRISLPLRPGDHPHLWATDDDAITISSVEDQAWNAPMGRIVTIAGLNGIGAGEGSVALTIRDDQGSWNNGVWTFTGRNGTLEVSEGGEPAGDITITGLSALVMSGMDPVTLPYRGWGQVEPETVAALRSLFPPAVPHLHELF